MAESISQIRTDIENTKDHINQTIGELEDRFQEMKDVHALVNRYPLGSVAVSVGVGILLSGKMGWIGKNVQQVLAASVSAFLVRQLKSLGKPQQISTSYTL